MFLQKLISKVPFFSKTGHTMNISMETILPQVIDISLPKTDWMVTPRQMSKMFLDGRTFAPFCEQLVHNFVEGFVKPESGNGSHNGYYRDGRVEIRCVTKSGVTVKPSIQLGGGRTADREAALEKIRSTDYFVFFNNTVPNYTIVTVVSKKDDRTWMTDTKSHRVSKAKFEELYYGMPAKELIVTSKPMRLIAK